ncbi:MAG: Xaa-Pro peptidase family protein [Treponema sp.]|jgi:Xaa-Pro dipeptidase|nr:Xaa-Pro peptidase family protein [Treponema sp.]
MAESKAAGYQTQTIYQKRRTVVYDWMAREGISLAMLEDSEGRRDSSIRYLCGMPADALLFLSVDRRAVLVPWDIHIAKLYADADHLKPYADFNRQPINACVKTAELLKLAPNSRIELPAATSYPLFLKYVEALSGYDAICREDAGLARELETQRSVKDEAEIKIYRTAGKITTLIAAQIEKMLRGGKIKTETDAALFIEAECRKHGCESTSFETLAAGPARSFAIHAFPAWTAETFGGSGLSILDFGVKYGGYCTDVTLTIARSPTKAQERLIALVEKARKIVLSKIKAGYSSVDAALLVEGIFGRAHKSMPHALGHGIGLDPHETPVLRVREPGCILEKNMVLAIEPGLYDPVIGGCRLENDYLVTEDGLEALTDTGIVYL